VYPLKRCSLEQRLHRRAAAKPLGPGIRLRCAAQIADAVQYIHEECGWLIRDLKTANILLAGAYTRPLFSST
jgi:serine/threonine protein kinase